VVDGGRARPLGYVMVERLTDERERKSLTHAFGKRGITVMTTDAHREHEDKEKNDDGAALLRADPSASPTTTKALPKYRMWALHCPFKKSGFPVLGTFGTSEKAVIIMTVETWKRLCADVPQLQTTEFEVGSYED
jgi:hypothetical protein